jgi:hypothetical protein
MAPAVPFRSPRPEPRKPMIGFEGPVEEALRFESVKTRIVVRPPRS